MMWLLTNCPDGLGEDHRRLGLGLRRRHVEFEVARGGDARRAELLDPPGIVHRLHQAELETGEQRRDGARHPAPAAEGGVTQAHR